MIQKKRRQSPTDRAFEFWLGRGHHGFCENLCWEQVKSRVQEFGLGGRGTLDYVRNFSGNK